MSSIVKNEINAQSNVDMNENYIILKDEFPITEERVKKFENESTGQSMELEFKK